MHAIELNDRETAICSFFIDVLFETFAGKTIGIENSTFSVDF